MFGISNLPTKDFKHQNLISHHSSTFKRFMNSNRDKQLSQDACMSLIESCISRFNDVVENA